LLTATPPSIPASAAFAGIASGASVATATATATSAVGVVGLRRRSRRLSFAARQVSASAVAHGDEQRGYVLAVLIGLLERRAGAVRGDALAAQADGHFIRLGIGAFDAALGVRLVQADVVDDLALFVVEATQKRAGAQQASKTAVGESGKSVCK
jgi:hypothetical protein